MLVIFGNGEQQLLELTLSKSSYTVQELLDRVGIIRKVLHQAGINVEPEDNIECMENHDSEVNFVMKV